MTATPWFMVGIAALLVGALLAALALALTDLSRARLEELAEDRENETLERRVRSILADVRGHAAAIALPAVAFFALAALADVMWVAALRASPTPERLDATIGLAAAALCVWIVGLWVPLCVADHAGERLVLAMGLLVRAFYLLMLPVRRVLAFFDEVVNRLAGPGPLGTPEALEQDIRDVVEEHANGEMDETERDMLEAVVAFRTTTVEEIMRPRTEVHALEYSDDPEKVKAVINEHGHSRIPVYEGDLDHVVGILYAKDLLRWLTEHGHNGRPFVLREILRDAKFVPETKTVRELLTELLAAQVHISMVADEYGGTSGLVTMEDIVEEVFGEIADEYDEPEEASVGVEIDEPTRSAEADARASIHDANHEMESIDLELPESDDYDTVGGFVVSTLGRIPDTAEAFAHEGVLVTILDAEPTRVVRVRLQPAPPEPEPDAELDHAAERAK